MIQLKEDKGERDSIVEKCKSWRLREVKWIERIENKNRLLKF